MLSARRLRAGGDLLFRMRDVLVGDADQNNDTVGDASRELEHLRPAGGDINRHFVFARMKQMNLAARQLGFLAGEELAHLFQ